MLYDKKATFTKNLNTTIIKVKYLDENLESHVTELFFYELVNYKDEYRNRYKCKLLLAQYGIKAKEIQVLDIKHNIKNKIKANWKDFTDRYLVKE